MVLIEFLVKKSYLNPVETFETNSIGTLKLLECLRRYKPKKKCSIVQSQIKCNLHQSGKKCNVMGCDVMCDVVLLLLLLSGLRCARTDDSITSNNNIMKFRYN